MAHHSPGRVRVGTISRRRSQSPLIATTTTAAISAADYLLGYRRDKPLRMPQPPFEGEM